MPGPRLPMRKIRDVLRLSAAGMSKRQIAASLGVSATAARDFIWRARRAGLAWPLADGLTDEALEVRLYPPPTVAAKDRRPQPDWAAVHRELRRAGVTLQLLWEEHRATHPDGYGYSRFCERYRAWEARLSPTMRQSHVAGERMPNDNQVGYSCRQASHLREDLRRMLHYSSAATGHLRVSP
jgi:hypothetical protein